MSKLNFKHLRYFWMVAKEGSIVRAGELLHLTPQTISGQLGLLEQALGVKLLAMSALAVGGPQVLESAVGGK